MDLHVNSNLVYIYELTNVCSFLALMHKCNSFFYYTHWFGCLKPILQVLYLWKEKFCNEYFKGQQYQHNDYR